MKKVKFFLNLFEERDWLEEMAREGWLLQNITWGIIYHFTECEPCEKVYEVERFAISPGASVADLSVRQDAMDMTSQFGWEVVTHDEEMNYYFMKEKAGDETDEFYDTEESRRLRAERFLNRYAVEAPYQTIKMMFWLSLLYFVLLVFFRILNLDGYYFAIFFLVYALLTSAQLWMYHKAGMVNDFALRMSREEWKQYRENRVKCKFRKVQQLRVFLQEQSEKGLSLTGFKDGYYLFEKDEQRYNYFVDTRACLQRRMKAEGMKYREDTKDFATLGLKWYEESMEQSAEYGLKPVAAIGNNLLIYKRPFSEERLPWENSNENVSLMVFSKAALILTIVYLLIGAAIGAVFAKGMVKPLLSQETCITRTTEEE